MNANCQACDFGLVGAEPNGADVTSAPVFTVPNLVTLSGYAAGVGWLVGGSPWLAAWSILADELDGDVARNSGQTSELGARLDSDADLILAALTTFKLGYWWALPPLLLVQDYWRQHRQEHGETVAFGSWRALATLWGLGRGL